MGRGVTRVFFACPPVGVLGPRQISLFEVQVPQPKQDLGLGFVVAQCIEEKRDAFLLTSIPTCLLGIGEGLLDRLAPLGSGQAWGVEQRSVIRSFTVWMSSHVWCLGLPLVLLALRSR